MKTLNECISCYDTSTSYLVKTTESKLEINKVLNDIYNFKWVFSLKKTPVKVTEK